MSRQGIGVFTLGSTVCGRGAVFNVAPDGSVSLNGPENSVAPGEVLTIFGTGLGAVSLSTIPRVALLPDGEPAPASPLAKAFQEIGFTVNRARVLGNGWPVLFAGRAPGLVGVDQVNVVLPESVPEGCSIPLQILSTYSAGQLVPISIRRGGGPCVDPLPDSGTMVVWRKTVSSGVFPPPAEEALELDFSAVIGKRFTEPLSVRLGGCLGRTNAQDTPNCRGVPKCCDLYENRLDAGGVTARPTGTAGLLYEPVFLEGRPSYMAVLPGGTIREATFTVSGAGGADVGAFESTVHIPAPIELTSSFPPGRNISSSRPLTVTWRGGAPDTLVRLRVISRLALRGQRPEALVAECLAWASAGSITLPTTGTQFPSIGLPSSAAAEIVVSVSAEGEQVQRFSARGLTLGGRHGWRYEFRFGGLTIQ